MDSVPPEKYIMTEDRLFLLLAAFTLSVSANPLPLPACMLALKTHPSCHEFLDNELPLVERECGAAANRSLAAVRPHWRAISDGNGWSGEWPTMLVNRMRGITCGMPESPQN